MGFRRKFLTGGGHGMPATERPCGGAPAVSSYVVKIL